MSHGGCAVIARIKPKSKGMPQQRVKYVAAIGLVLVRLGANERKAGSAHSGRRGS